MPVSTPHPEYTKMLPIVTMVRDAVAGDPAIKLKKEIYLPADFAKDPDTGNYTDHYRGYLNRSYFLGVTGRTKEAMIGMVFRKMPEFEAPSQIEAYMENIDGAGQSLDQIAKQVTGELLESGKYFLLVDFPSAPENLDSETEKKLGLRPVIAPYPLESLINWRFEGMSGSQKLTLAVLRESVEIDETDEFSHDSEYRYRVLRLRDGVYTQQIYDNGGKATDEEYTPRMAGGKPFDHIPLHIAGAKNNLPGIDQPPLYDIARVNISHYQTTANVKESGYIGTQPMIHVDVGETDITEWKEHNPGNITLGNRSGLVTKGGKLEIVQASATDYNMTVMDREELQMVALGAQMITRGGQAETAEAARIDASAEASVLEVVVGNASEMIEAALEDFALFLGLPAENIKYSLSKDFWETGLDAQSLQAVIQARQMGSIGSKDVLYMIRQGSIKLNPERTDEDILSDASSELLDNLPQDM
jgi:hypothetical protein